MNSATHSRLASFIWRIADDVLRDLYVRGKYRDVLLPFTVLRRLDSVLEPTKQRVLDMKQALDESGITNQEAALRDASGSSCRSSRAGSRLTLSRGSSTCGRSRSRCHTSIRRRQPRVSVLAWMMSSKRLRATCWRVQNREWV